MKQYQAGYMLDAVRGVLAAIKEDKVQQARVQGLLNQLSTFDMTGPAEDAQRLSVHAVLAVVHNIITRGMPTLPSEMVEETFADILRLTRSENGNTLKYPFQGDNRLEERILTIVQALHIVDPRARQRQTYLNLADTDSSFERSFLLEMIPENKSFLTQLFQHQRSRSSFTRDQNAGRVDFSLEIPYFHTTQKLNKFRQETKIKCQSRYVVEVDGKAYHNDLIDDMKDVELGQLPIGINHVKQDSAYKDAEQLIDKLSTEAYVQAIEANYSDQNWLTSPMTALVLSPFLIARIQFSLLEYLIDNQDSLFEYGHIRLAVVERDIPAARVAVSDLVTHLDTLNQLAGSPLEIPTIELSVFVTPEFAAHPLHSDADTKSLNACDPANFDLVLDVSILRRSGIFADDDRFNSDHTWILRSSHFTHHLTTNPIYCAPCISYQSVTYEIDNEVHEEKPVTVALLRYFMRNIFRKADFRDGQLPIMNRALQLKSVIGLLPTGGGKSLTYQLASLLQPGITIVVDPIRSLMQDQYRGLRELGIDRCAYINSTLPVAEKRYNQNKLLVSGQLQFVFISPERFVIQEFRNALETSASNHYYFAYTVIDEVHCVSEWGHDFRTPYLNLGGHAIEFCKTYTGLQIPLYGLTATASFDVLADIERELQIPNDDGMSVVRYENTVRDEINYAIINVALGSSAPTSASAQKIKNMVGVAKQVAAFKLLEQKETLLHQFNTEKAIERIVDHSWDNYVPTAHKARKITEFGEETDALLAHVAKQQDALKLPKLIFTEPASAYNDGKFSYGTVVFTPHRNGSLGIMSNGMYEHACLTKVDGQPPCFKHDVLGYFMGSGDDVNAKEIDDASFDNLNKFTDDRLSVMVATKAFGMGIDKPNIRLTIHLTIPQSIESFVQEAGRAGRDKKLSCSVILYNNEHFRVQDRNRTNDYHQERDVLMYFHKNAFKGQVKERAMIFELRNQVTFPHVTNARRIANLLNELYGSAETIFKVKCGRNKWENHLFVSVGEDTSIGNIALTDRRITLYSDFADQATRLEIMQIVQSELPTEIEGPQELGSWLEQIGAYTRQEIGIEKLLADMETGETAQLEIPFSNRYYTNPADLKYGGGLNEHYVASIKATNTYQQLIQDESIDEGTFLANLTNANAQGESFEEFIEQLNLTDQGLLEKLRRTVNPDQLHIRYYRGRSQEDTAKAIYRLISIGVIDAYTIDYQNKLYTVHFTKKALGSYFMSFEELMTRYTSRRAAASEIGQYRQDYKTVADTAKVTELSFCLEKLTTFIYDKIKEKRIQSIEDMITLAKRAIEKDDPLEQSELVKDEIYYYFNAKYSRRNFHEPATGQEASLPDDREANLSTDAIIRKYISLVSDPRTGQFMNNIKHLRGSAMRMIRSYTDQPSYFVLKAYALLMLSAVSATLLEESKRDLVKGLVTWKQQEPDLNPVEFLTYFQQEAAKHMDTGKATVYFDEIEDAYYAQYYAAWTTKLAQDKLHIH